MGYKKYRTKLLSKRKPERFRIRTIKSTDRYQRRQRLGFSDGDVVEVVEFRKKKTKAR